MRRAILFSLTSILLSSFFILLFWSASSPRLDVTSEAVEARVEVIDYFIGSWESYMEDAIRLSARESLMRLTEYVIDDARAIPNLSVVDNITSCLLFNRTDINGSGRYGSCLPAGSRQTLGNRLDNFTALAKAQLGFETRYRISENITVEDWAPFEIVLRVELNYTINDTFGFWNVSKSDDGTTDSRLRVVVTTIGLPDPLFARYASTKIPNAALQSRNLTKFSVPRGLLTIYDMTELIDGQGYVANKGMGPTYLQRLAGNLSDPDPLERAGIETLLYPSFTNVAPLQANSSFTAHQIFNGTIMRCADQTIGFDDGSGLLPPGFPADFYLDTLRMLSYNMTDEAMWDLTCPD